MQHIKGGSSLVVMAGLLTALVVVPAIRAHAGSEGNITNPGSSPSAAPATPAAAESPAPTRRVEKRKHAEPEERVEKRKHAEPARRTASKSAPRRAEQAPERATAPAQAPSSGSGGISIGIGGVSIGF